MKKIHRIASAIALATLAGPAVAGPVEIPFDTRDEANQRHAFMFSGATVRLALDGRDGQRRPEFAMRFAGGSKANSGFRRIGDGIAFGATAGEKPTLKLAGQDARLIGKRMNMSEGAKVALIAGGIVVALGVVVLLAADEAVDDINEDGGCCL